MHIYTISIILPFQANYISWMPNLVFGVLGITGSILAFWLPETRHRALPQTVAEMEHWQPAEGEENKCRKCECFKRRQSPNTEWKIIFIVQLQFALSAYDILHYFDYINICIQYMYPISFSWCLTFCSVRFFFDVTYVWIKNRT